MALPVKLLSGNVKRRSKYGSTFAVENGIRFRSKAEANRYLGLRLLEQSGEIQGLELQPTYKCTINGVLVCKYVADFRYFTRPTNTKRGEYIVEDVKGHKTALYKLKKKLVEALYPGVVIVEITR